MRKLTHCLMAAFMFLLPATATAQNNLPGHPNHHPQPAELPLSCKDIPELHILLEKGSSLYDLGEFGAALAPLDQGLEHLGNAYWSEDLVDDTGQKLLLANSFEKEGNYQGAAYIKENMLQERLQLFEAKCSEAGTK